MSILDFFRKKSNNNTVTVTTKSEKQSDTSKNGSQFSYVDGSSVALDERPFYQPDNYYTYFSNPGTPMAREVVTFEKRKNCSNSTARGLYVAEILLLDYCNQGDYPKPRNGYPGFWWFEYGIRDVGNALASLEKRGYLKWASPQTTLKNLRVEDIRRILNDRGLPTSGTKADLVNRICADIGNNNLLMQDISPKYELTTIGKQELSENGYIPYMHKHSRISFGEDGFNVWTINKLFSDGNAQNWRTIVGKIESQRFGVNIAGYENDKQPSSKTNNREQQREEMRSFLATKQTVIQAEIRKKGDGLDEELQGIDLKKAGRDKEALVKFYIAIGKHFDAPALYRETTILLRKYGMYEEEMAVINDAIRNAPKFKEEFLARRKKTLELMKKEQQ